MAKIYMYIAQKSGFLGAKTAQKGAFRGLGKNFLRFFGIFDKIAYFEIKKAPAVRPLRRGRVGISFVELLVSHTKTKPPLCKGRWIVKTYMF
jgi:hypothetical protein